MPTRVWACLSPRSSYSPPSLGVSSLGLGPFTLFRICVGEISLDDQRIGMFFSQLSLIGVHQIQLELFCLLPSSLDGADTSKLPSECAYERMIFVCSDKVIVPLRQSCCGFFQFPLSPTCITYSESDQAIWPAEFRPVTVESRLNVISSTEPADTTISFIAWAFCLLSSSTFFLSLWLYLLQLRNQYNNRRMFTGQTVPSWSAP